MFHCPGYCLNNLHLTKSLYPVKLGRAMNHLYYVDEAHSTPVICETSFTLSLEKPWPMLMEYGSGGPLPQ
jgi:hypothetical protein